MKGKTRSKPKRITRVVEDKNIGVLIIDSLGMATPRKRVEHPRIREGPSQRLSQHIDRRLEHEVYVTTPLEGCNIPPDWEALAEYARQHPEAMILLWLNGEIKEL
jgi:hypothetical protein